MGAVVVPVYLVPALAAVLALGIAAESDPNWPTAVTVSPARQGRKRPRGLPLISPDDEL